MSKYIDVETLKVVLESRIEAGLDGYGGNLKWLLESIDTLQQEQPDFADTSKMEQPSVEEAMKELDEKIALVKERGTWDGVDVDKYMDDVRGREPEVDITKEIEEHAEDMPHCEFSHTSEVIKDEEWAKEEFRYFYELGLNSHKKHPDINLEEEIEAQISLLNGHHKLDDAGRKWHTGTYEELFSFARHFFELGLHARKQ